MPLPSPPLKYPATVLCLCHVAAYKTLGFLGLSITSVAPIQSESPRVLTQDIPPSTDL